MEQAREHGLVSIGLVTGLGEDERDSVTAVVLRACARCGQSFLPHAPRASRLCPPCLFRVATTYAGAERERLLELVAELAEVPDRDTLVARLGSGLQEILGVVRCWVFVRGDDGAFALGYPEERSDDVPPRRRPLTADDGTRPTSGAPSLRDWGLEVVIPLRFRGRLTGVLAIGPRKDGQPLDEPLIGILRGLVPSVALAIDATRVGPSREDASTEDAPPDLVPQGTAAEILHHTRNLLVPLKVFLDVLPPDCGGSPDLAHLRRVAAAHLARLGKLLDEPLAPGRAPEGPPPRNALGGGPPRAANGPKGRPRGLRRSRGMHRGERPNRARGHEFLRILQVGAIDRSPCPLP